MTILVSDSWEMPSHLAGDVVPMSRYRSRERSVVSESDWPEGEGASVHVHPRWRIRRGPVTSPAREESPQRPSVSDWEDVEPYDPSIHGAGPADLVSVDSAQVLEREGFEPEDRGVWSRRVTYPNGNSVGANHVITYEPGHRRPTNGERAPWILTTDPETVGIAFHSVHDALSAANADREQIRHTSNTSGKTFLERRVTQFDQGWESLTRLGAQPESAQDPYEEFSDIWRGHSGRGNENAAAQQWLNERVRYDRPDTAFPESLSPHQWIAHPEEEIPYDVQHEETNRDIDSSHEAFLDALHRGLHNDYSGPGMYNPGGQAEPEPYEPTSEERLRSDEGWLLGPNRTFNWPGGREQYATTHNGMYKRGFDLDNEGTDENPSPVYVHRQTHARIRPGVDESGEPTWALSSPGAGTTHHSSPAAAAMAHQQRVQEQQQRESEEYQRQRRTYDPASAYEQRGRSISRSPRGPVRREAPDYIPKTKAREMSWGSLFDQAVHGNGGHGREFERASVRSELNPVRENSGRLYGVHEQQWDQDFADDAAGQGRVSQAIYHYATPIAWKYHRAQPDGTYDEGTWRLPATSFGSAGFFNTGRVQGLMGPTFYRGGPGAVSHERLRDPQVDFVLHQLMEEGGVHRQPDQSYRSVDAFGNEHHLQPSQSGKTFMHTVTAPGGRTFKKRVPAIEGASAAVQMGRPALRPDQLDDVSYLRRRGYRDSAHVPTPRREVPLRVQPELPGMPPLRRRQSHRLGTPDWSEITEFPMSDPRD